MNDSKIEELVKAYHSFKYFSNNIFSHSFEGQYINGKHLDEWANILQDNDFVSFLSARKHSKSTKLYAYVMWKLLRSIDQDLEILYLSYNSNLAAYHTRNIKTFIQRNPYFEECIDLTPAEGILKYTWDNEHIFRVEPEGMLSFKRGRHPDIVLVDDPLQDPAAILNLTVIQKITRIFLEEIMSLPKEKTGEIKVVGTAQDERDLFFTIKKMKRFLWKEYKAIQSYKQERVLWPEMFPFERLISIRDEEIGEKAFNKEYQCSPVRTEEAFFKREDIMPVVNPTLKNLKRTDKIKTKNSVFGGMDIGKKRNPTHIAIFENVKNRLIQRHQIFLDGWDYTDQVDYCYEIIPNFKVDMFLYDDTRGELEGYREENKLPEEMRPYVFSLKSKSLAATTFEGRVRKKKIELIDDERMIGQILSVDNSLTSIATAQGHGDSFWSIALACVAAREVGESEVVDSGIDEMFGKPSMFPRLGGMAKFGKRGF